MKKKPIKKISPERRAEQYQQAVREIKKLELTKKALYDDLKEYAETHRQLFDQANQIKFKCGVIVTTKQKKFIDGNHEAVLKAFGDDFTLRQLDQKKLITQADQQPLIMRKLENNGGKIDFKEIIAITAN